MHWWSLGSFFLNLLKKEEKNKLKVKRGCNVNIFKRCVEHWNESRSVVRQCMVKCYCEWGFKKIKYKKKAQCTVHSSPNRNSTHFRGFHHKSRSSSNNHFLSSVVLHILKCYFFDSVVALHLYRYCPDPKEKREKKNLFLCYFLVW